MNNAQTIPPKNKPFAPNAPKHLDYDFLREAGLKHIQDLSGQLWTDHNTHDPGITILEVLCYALTDLAYRTHLPDADLFAPDPKKRTTLGDDNFPTAYTMLSCNPLTELDWRKLLLDIKGVRNAWFVPIETEKLPDITLETSEKDVIFGKGVDARLWKNELWRTESLVFLDKEKQELTFENGESKQNYPLSIRGVYKVLLELEQNVEDKEPILEEVQRRLAGFRNLCEDFGSINIVQDEPLMLCAEFELDATAQPDTVLLDIFNRIQEYFSPTVQFHTLSDMLKKGRTMEEIYAGRPLLPESHGFVDTVELEDLTLPSEIHVSDLYYLILGDDLKENPNGLKGIEGISAIKKLLVINPKIDKAEKGEAWKVMITEGSRPTLNVAESIKSISFFKRGVPYRVNGERVTNLFGRRLANASKVVFNLKDEQSKGKTNLDKAVPTGEYRPDLGEHISIQGEFPVVYGIGESAVPEAAGIKRQAQAAQLKGYLTFFDHILANYLAQIANIRTLFSPKLTNDGEPMSSDSSFEKAWLGLSPDLFTPLAPVADLRTSIPNADALFGFAQNNDIVQIGSSKSSKTKPLFNEGDLIGESQVTYSTPHDRDRALRQLIADVDADLVKIETKTWTQTGELDRYYFLFISELGRLVTLKSAKTYSSIAEAKAAAQAVRFVATLESSFEKYDNVNDALPNYSFKLFYRPPQYNAYLRSILEDEATFFKNKNRFFDHLLSRFAEDFTDYTLLTFATLRNNGLQIDAENNEVMNRKFAVDKARFLEKYPEISRNRAKAMDFSQSLWTDANQSGLENRVSKLIGIAERGTKTLNYFDITSQPTRYRFLISDVHGKALMRSTQTFVESIRIVKDNEGKETKFKESTEAQKARLIALNLGKNKALFEPTYCFIEKVYGFRLLDYQGCPVAESVHTFGSAALRDMQMRYVQGIIAGDGVMRAFRAHTEGVFFEIKDNEGGILRADMGVADETAALNNLAVCLQALPILSNWRPIDEAHQRGFGFEILDNQSVIAIYSVFFETQKERDERLKLLYNYFKRNKLPWQTQAHPPRYRWQVVGRNNEMLLTARHYLSTAQHAAAAWLEAKRAIIDDSFGKLVAINVGDKFGIELQRFVKDENGQIINGESLILAQATFEKLGERDGAFKAIQSLVKVLDVTDAMTQYFWENQTTKKYGAARLDTEEGKFSLNLLTEDGSEGLFGDLLFDDKNEALAATFAIERTITEGVSKVVNVAELKDNYHFFTDNGGCIHSFNVQNETTVLANFQPYLYSKDEARAKRRALVAEVQHHKLDIDLKHVINQRWFDIMDESCDEQIVPILRGYKIATDAQGILGHYNEFQAEIKSGTLTHESIQTDNGYKFQFNNWAESLLFFKTKVESDAAAKAFTAWLAKNYAMDDATQIKPIEAECENATPFPNANRWRLSDADNPIARYVGRVFDEGNKAKAAVFLEKLIEQYTCGQPTFSMIFENTDNFDRDILGHYWFILRDGEQLYWRSPSLTPFGSASEALTAFNAQHVGLLMQARDIQHYRIRSRKVKEQTIFFIELLGLDSKPMAESVETATDTEGVNNLMGNLQKHALAYPIVKNADNSFSFQLFDAQKQAVLWQSCPRFKTQEAAKAAFSSFLDVLKYRYNYRLVASDDACRWAIELVEVLLDEVTNQRYKDTANEDTSDCDWLTVEYFIDNLLDAGKAAFVPTVDYLNCCGYGFNLAQMDYRLARHPSAFHTKTAREQRRDDLWHDAKCRKEATTEGSAIAKIIEDIAAGKYQQLLDKCQYDDESQEEKENFKLRRQEALQEALKAMPNERSWLVLTDAHGQLQLGITRADGSLIIVFEEWTAETADLMKAEIARLYEYINFSSQVIALPDGTFGFEIREKTTDKTDTYINGFVDGNCDSIPVALPVFKVVWRNIKAYKSVGEAQEAVNKVNDLLLDKAHYARTNAADGSPTLEIVDPSKIIAQHPRTYTTSRERDAAWQRVRQHIHTEGMHLVEHLLLRPRYGDDEPIGSESANKRLLPSYLIRNDVVEETSQTDIAIEKNVAVQPNVDTQMNVTSQTKIEPEPETEIKHFDPSNDDMLFDDYIMGADPYSFWLTVVLPHWSERFRDLDFRDFFEGTLRREAPAHVGMNILWVNPIQMKQFEKVWRSWLEVATDPTHYLYACRKQCLIEVFKNLKSVTPEAGLLDCDTGVTGKLIILDKTTLR